MSIPQQPPPCTLPFTQRRVGPGCVPVWCAGSMLLWQVSGLSLQADVQALGPRACCALGQSFRCLPTTADCYSLSAVLPLLVPLGWHKDLAADRGWPLHLRPSAQAHLQLTAAMHTTHRLHPLHLASSSSSGSSSSSSRCSSSSNRCTGRSHKTLGHTGCLVEGVQGRCVVRRLPGLPASALAAQAYPGRSECGTWHV
jgi:hypothetical protein